MSFLVVSVNLEPEAAFKPIFTIPYTPQLNTLNLSLKLSKRLSEDKTILISNKNLKLEDIGLNIIYRDPGTAYHSPEGSLIWYCNKENKRSQKLIKLAKTNYIPEITEIAPTICKILNVRIPDHMKLDSPLINCG